VASFKARLRGRTVVSKVARWDPDKSWLLTIDTIGAMKRVGWRPLLIARGGVEPYGAEVLGAAARAGLRVADRRLIQPGSGGLMQTLQGLGDIDILNLCSPLDPEGRLVLFHSVAAVLANSQHEPFGLVGLETMAAGGVACIGYTGEDYAVPGHNALALETNDPQEFLDLFGTLRLNPPMERALRRAGRITAQHFTWSQIMQRILLPRLHLMACASDGRKKALRGRRQETSKLLHTASRPTKLLAPTAGEVGMRNGMGRHAPAEAM
jgi:glycosyltransferase involved in cell wall biosynthesis